MQKGDIAAVRRDPKDKTLRLRTAGNQSNESDGRFAPILDGTHREAVGAVVEVQRVHARRVEGQVTTVVRRARNRRPIGAVAADVVRRPRRAVATPRSRKEDRTARSVVAPSPVILLQ